MQCVSLLLIRISHIRYVYSCSSSSELDSQYPQFPSEKQLKHNLVSVQDCSEEPKHTVLLKFLEDCHRLAVGSDLLPDLVEFYLWLDVHLAHLIRYEVAQTLSVGQLLERVEARPRSTGKKLQTLYGRLMSMWLSYAENILLCNVPHTRRKPNREEMVVSYRCCIVLHFVGRSSHNLLSN